MQKPFLLILCGIPSSGKSTLARGVASRLEKEYGFFTVAVTSDAFRHMVPTYSRIFEPELEHFVREATYRTVEEALRRKLLVISDDVNYYRSIRRQLKRIAERAGASFAIVYVDTPLEVALRWNGERGEPVPNTVIEEMHHKLDRPGEKYMWDTPLLTVDPSRSKLEELTQLVASKVAQKVREEEDAPAEKRLTKLQSIRMDLDRETRQAMGEVMKRYGNLDLAREISDLRKKTIDEAVKRGLSVVETTGLFYERAELILKSNKRKFEGETMLHVGLFGHVDHGKTQLARCLTDIPSTAGLDKHPQAQERGMSIDMGFSAFNLGKHVVTLVDLPGHHSLIRHVVAGANIIDQGILVVAANEGPKVQTVEHLQILTSLGIERLIVAINKIDLIEDKELDQIREKVENLLKKTPFENSPIVLISAIKCEGIQELKETLVESLSLPVRHWSGSLKIPISHSFHISGIGTVVTGTILRGKVRVGDSVEILPHRKECRVRSIQIFGKDVKEASAGDRVGMTLLKVRSKDLSRGDIVVTPGAMGVRDLLDVEVEVMTRYGGSLRQRDTVHINIGLKTVLGQIYPYTTHQSMKILRKSVSPGSRCMALINMQQALPVEVGDKVLLVKLDLPHERSRIVGVAKIAALPRQPEIYAAKIKKGIVQKKTHDGLYVVSGLFKTKEAAQHVAEKRRKLFAAESKAKATVVRNHGDEGDVIASFETSPILSEDVYYYRLRRVKVD